MVEQAVEHGGDRSRIAEELSPVLDRPVPAEILEEAQGLLEDTIADRVS